MPKTPALNMTMDQADALPAVIAASQPQLFKKDGIEAVIPAGELYKDKIIVLRLIKDSYPERPLYFTSSSYPRALGLASTSRARVS